MNLKKFLCFLAIALLVCSNIYVSKAENKDLMEDIINKTNSQVVERGFKVKFDICDSIENVKNELVTMLKCENFIISNIEGNFIEFSGKDKQALIELNEEDNIVRVQVQYTLNGQYDALQLEKFQSIIYNKFKQCNNIKKYKYVKSKVKFGNNQQETKKNILSILNSYMIKNVRCVPISNGYSGIANTNKFEEEKYGDSFIDFNFAICSYNSGSYLIMATPEIYISY